MTATDPDPLSGARPPTAEEVVRSVAAWAWSAAVFLVAPVLALLTLGLAGRWLSTQLPRVWGRVSLAILGLEVEYRGLEHLRVPGSRIVVANHQSALDLPLVGKICPEAPLVLAKAELRWVFPFNLMWVALGQRFVDRRDPIRARASVAGVVASLDGAARSVILAPEGTRSRSGRLGRFKLGAFHMAVATGLPIVPICIHGAGRCLPPGSWFVKRGRCVVEVFSPLDTRGWTVEDVHGEAIRLAGQYRAWLGE